VWKERPAEQSERDRGTDAQRDRPGLAEDLAADCGQQRDHAASGAGVARSSRRV
jgi:hypothetical protein